MSDVPAELMNNVKRRLEAMYQEIRSIQQTLPPHEDDCDVSELLTLEYVLVDLEDQLATALDDISATRRRIQQLTASGLDWGEERA